MNVDAARDQRLDRGVEVGRAERDVLDALAAVLLEVLLDLALLAGVLVDRDADLAVGAGHRARVQPGMLAGDVEVADLPEVEHPLVEAGPLVEPAAMHVVGQVVDVAEARPRSGCRILVAQPLEVDVVDRALGAVAIDQVDVQAADALDGRNLQFVRTGRGVRPAWRRATARGRRRAGRRRRGRPWPAPTARAWRRTRRRTSRAGRSRSG